MHFEISKYYRSTGKAHAKVLQSLKVRMPQVWLALRTVKVFFSLKHITSVRSLRAAS